MPQRVAKRFPRWQPSMENSKAPSPAGSKFRRAGGIFCRRPGHFTPISPKPGGIFHPPPGMLEADDLCYSWAEEYFRNMDIEEDQEKKDVYVPLSRPAASRPGKKKSTPKDHAAGNPDGHSTTETSEKGTGNAAPKAAENVQLSLFDMETEVPNEEKLPA